MRNDLIQLNQELISGIRFPIYIKVGNDYSEILDVSKNTKFISNFINQSVENPFYVKKNDLFLFIRDYKDRLKNAKNEEDRKKMILVSGDLMFSNLIAQNFSDDSISNGFSLVLNTVTENKDILSDTIKILSTNTNIGSQSLLRSIICFLIAQSLDWTMAKNYQNLIISSILADIGEVLSPNEPHPINSMKHIGRYKENQNVSQIIMHHHENLDGSGNLGLTKFKIHPLAKVLRVADELVIQSQGKTLSEGLFTCLNFKKNIIDKEPLEKLIIYLRKEKIFKVN